MRRLNGWASSSLSLFTKHAAPGSFAPPVPSHLVAQSKAEQRLSRAPTLSTSSNHIEISPQSVARNQRCPRGGGVARNPKRPVWRFANRVICQGSCDSQAAAKRAVCIHHCDALHFVSRRGHAIPAKSSGHISPPSQTYKMFKGCYDMLGRVMRGVARTNSRVVNCHAVSEAA